MNILKERRKRGAVCSICQSPDYVEAPPDYEGGKPNFVCKSCGTWWQYGYDGGKYSELAGER
jgi:transposase-like protein